MYIPLFVCKNVYIAISPPTRAWARQVQERYVADLCREIRLRGQQCPQRGHHFLRGRHPYGFNHGPADPDRDGAAAAGRLAAAGGSNYGGEPGHDRPGQVTGFKGSWVLTG
jgi:hypothetical protein